MGQSTYGTLESDVFKYLIEGGHKPIGISVMACEETLPSAHTDVYSAIIFIDKPCVSS